MFFVCFLSNLTAIYIPTVFIVPYSVLVAETSEQINIIIETSVKTKNSRSQNYSNPGNQPTTNILFCVEGICC